MERPLPRAARWVLRRARALACLIDAPAPGPVDHEGAVDLDIVIDGGRIGAFLRTGEAPVDLPGYDAGRGLVWPALVDLHTHLDKCHIWPRAANPDGTGLGAVGAVAADRAKNWSSEDVAARFEFGLACAYAHGVAAIRTHLDSQSPQAAISFPVFRGLRDKWAGRIDLQATSLCPPDTFLSDAGETLADIVAQSGGQLGCGSRFPGQIGAAPPPEFDTAMDRFFTLAAERGLDVDLHIDESSDPAARALPKVAAAALRARFKGRILVGHCCALALQDDAYIERTLTLCADAGIGIVSLPACNMYLQDRKPGRTPRWRGITLLHEAKARDIRVAVAGDNVRDPFYAYGDHDMLETFVQATRILQLDHPFGDWARAASATPAEIMGKSGTGLGVLKPGGGANFLILRARRLSELLARREDDRIVVRDGAAIAAALPDYAALDAIAGGP
jgi:cytosine deaminase